ncbi:MAG: tripartite tricarboxylate transporter substrate binding protein [Hydrogenophaga sp.]|uniref:Bug family tripartite tricarboxylate transporter substrate binding protein n=1 Tax=Hydrogenophaga sp. TaxID=1904254 RepID=UPI00261EA451|nr:tripartite tricarboxylate transporter substrate binding protein [Hydrogenophaga sp.]MCW5668706.1 tripartite tricarboxylate transporter substrate binding protein [Hydrogenophaga sp.]
MNRRIASLLAVLGLLATTPAALAQAPYPSRPIRLVVPYPAGGGTDVVARKVAEMASVRLGQPIVIDNKPGANGSIGTGEVARAAADGYTLAWAIPDSLISVASLVKSPSYDARRDLTAIVRLVASPVAVMTSTDSDIKSVQDLLARGRAQPGKLTYGSWGPGTLPHLLMATIDPKDEGRFVQLPYRGQAPAIQDVVARQIQIGFAPPHIAAQYVQKGMAHVIAVVSDERSALMPHVPTLAEQAVEGDLARSRLWMGVVGPRGLPASVVDRLSTEFTAVVASPDFKSFLSQVGMAPYVAQSGDFSAQIGKEFVTTNSLIRKLGVVAE